MSSSQWILLIGIGWIGLLLIAALMRARWLVDPPRWTSYLLYFPALLRESLSAERTRIWIVALLLAALLALLALAVSGTPG